MAPLVVLGAVSLLLLTAGALGIRRFRSWPLALRGGLVAMFVLTGCSHFTGMRADLIAMVPPQLPAPDLLVTLTGVLELAGAAGLLLPRTTPWAAGGLAGVLITMVPANVYAALNDVSLGAAPAMPLVPRTLLQLVFLAATLAVCAQALRAGTSGSSAASRAGSTCATASKR